MATAAKKAELQNSTALFVIMASDKGGVGKSFFFRFLAEHLRKHKGESVLLFDGDGGTGSSFRIFGTRDADGFLIEDQNPAVGIMQYNLRKARPRETLINSVTLGGAITLHDLPGGAFDAMTEIADNGDESLHGIFEGVLSEGQQPVVFHLVHHEDESTESVARYLDATEGLEIKHIAVLNFRDADSKEDFEMWFGYTDEHGEKIGGRTRERLLASGGFELIVPRLAPSAASRIKRYNLTFEQATTDKRLTLAQRTQVSRWYREMTKALMENDAFKALFDL
ncbi:hypothetical protein J2857_006124 [Neorhizobium galegae]|uniref:hypothetical protein n=1 Tax=Neorhizobium galegae TaxID=399 RepID=UPI001AE8F70E|nr:hypothetical protein [Neorhizobium galegae]MBP2563325.1 hypothetical protein [Neorhizobium galegae]